MRTATNYDVGTTFKHPWIRNQTDKKPTTCIVTQIRDGVVHFRGYRPDRTLGSWTGELSAAALETHVVLSNVLRIGDDTPEEKAPVAVQHLTLAGAA
jgi:hypothetical protein